MIVVGSFCCTGSTLPAGVTVAPPLAAFRALRKIVRTPAPGCGISGMIASLLPPLLPGRSFQCFHVPL